MQKVHTLAATHTTEWCHYSCSKATSHVKPTVSRKGCSGFFCCKTFWEGVAIRDWKRFSYSLHIIYRGGCLLFYLLGLFFFFFLF